MLPLSDELKSKWLYGSPLPFAEAPWARGCPSPYYRDSHRRLRHAMRTWVETHLIPHVHEWEKSESLPHSLYQQAADDGLLMPMASGASIRDAWKGKYPIIGDVPADEWDGFHDLIIHDEFGRVGGIGIENGLVGGVTLAVPAIERFGTDKVKQSVVPNILSGRSRIALAITEPDAGSDVRGLQTEAKLSEDGSHFIINGQKKVLFLPNNLPVDYFLTLVREETGNFTLLVIARTEGVSTKHMAMSGSTAAGTAFVDFDDVIVPLDMVVGERGNGLKYVMSNFNHETVHRIPGIKVCKSMPRRLDKSLVYQLSQLSPQESEFLLAGTTAQLKAHAGIVLEHVVREAIQIMGGVGLTRGGRGARVERIWRDVKAITVPGGSEEILLDLAAKRALKISAEMQKIAVRGRL
ncbi:hypothetical protein G7Z17_g2923 [Cylindrodendrum hubeiense]|uniref:Acyl-CoA dehydrogenase n=1 Tax=Cylindrodendrum hubeiense TaxID=595255 RepID=A0A9P5HHY0_9HYPO|nr:hypothetical protein G7Z17_g2923 [Cylindrodendrum hubeiense]